MAPPKKSQMKRHAEEKELASALLQFRSVEGSTSGTVSEDLPPSLTPQQNGTFGNATSSPTSSAYNRLNNVNHPTMLLPSQPLRTIAQARQNQGNSAYSSPSVAFGGLGGQFNTGFASSHQPPFSRQAMPNSLSFLVSLDRMNSQARQGIQDSLPSQQQAGLSSQTEVETTDERPRTDSPERTEVRKDQIEAALHSKPQRGRKREDLNDLERLELTRTRNREHAKTTRIRKKARYQELLDGERELHDYKKKLSLEIDRRNTVLQYVKARQQMILKLGQSEASASSGETDPADNTSSTPFHDLVEDISQFSFEIEDEDIDDDRSTALHRMVAFDESLFARIGGRFGSTAAGSIQYVVRRGSAGVGLDGANGGIAEMDVTLASDSPVVVQSGFIRFQFVGPESSKLSSVCWCPTKDYLARDGLNAQVSHPSVVSLDPAVTGTEGTMLNAGTTSAIRTNRSEYSKDGPGMNIY